MNEIFVILGFVIYSANKKYLIPYFQPKVLILVNFLIYYGAAHVIVSFFVLKDNSVYTFVRTSVVWYSIFAFFIGVKFTPALYGEVRVMRKPLCYILASLPLFIMLPPKILPFPINVPLLAMLSSIPLILHRIRSFEKLTIIFMGAAAIQSVSLTIWLIFFSYLVLLLAIRYDLVRFLTFNRIVIFVVVLSLFATLFYMNYTFSKFYIKGFKVFPKRIDTNSMWRIMFWAEQIKDNFVKHPFFGIGFGTKLFNRHADDTKFLLMTGGRKNKILEYVQGTHNSFIFILIRMGILGFFPLIMLLMVVVEEFFRKKYYKDPLAMALFSSFLSINVAACFNVVLESPLYSGTYWIFCGMLFKRFLDIDVERMHGIGGEGFEIS